MTQHPPPPDQPPAVPSSPSSPSSLPGFPAAGGWGAGNADQMRPRPRRSLASALVALTGWAALTFLAAYGVGWVLLSVLDALTESANNTDRGPDDTLSAAQVAGYAAVFALIVFALHWVVGALLLILLRIGEGYASWSPLVQGLLAWVVAAPVAVILLILVGSLAGNW